MLNLDLSNRRAVVTGASLGIGAAAVRTLAGIVMVASQAAKYPGVALID